MDVNPKANENQIQTSDATPKINPYIKSSKDFFGIDNSILVISFVLII